VKILITFLFINIFSGFSVNFPETVKRGTKVTFRAGTTMRGDIRLGDRKEDVKIFKAVVTFLEHHKNWLFRFEVHTDQRGSKKANKKLSKIKAQNIISSLEKYFGLTKGILKPKGYGERRPLVPLKTINSMNLRTEKEKAYSLNRRFVIKAIRKLRKP